MSSSAIRTGARSDADSRGSGVRRMDDPSRTGRATERGEVRSDAVANAPAHAPARGGDLLTIGFATTVVMWGVGYLAHLPGMAAPSWLVFVLMVSLMVGGGAVHARMARRGALRAGLAGAVTGLLNLLILGSVLGEDLRAAASAALLWGPGSIGVSIASFALGAACSGVRARTGDEPPVHWPAWFGLTALGATLLLISAGGVVTGSDAGLAVPDWPNTYGYMMFLYPLSKMTGGIYFEHAHRLLGSLVGLTTLAYVAYLWRVEARRWVRWLGVAAVVLVIVQGLLGALRVTGRFTLSADATELAPNLTLAIVHGVLAQVFFSLLAAMWLFQTAGWRRPGEPDGAVRGSGLSWGLIALALLFVQIAVGATVRHASWGLHLHVTLAFVVALAAGVCHFRAWTGGANGFIRRHAGGLLVALVAQLVLGFAALAAILIVPSGAVAPAWHVLLTTAHQTLGALLLAGTAVLVLIEQRTAAATPTAG